MKITRMYTDCFDSGSEMLGTPEDPPTLALEVKALARVASKWPEFFQLGHRIHMNSS